MVMGIVLTLELIIIVHARRIFMVKIVNVSTGRCIAFAFVRLTSPLIFHPQFGYYDLYDFKST